MRGRGMEVVDEARLEEESMKEERMKGMDGRGSGDVYSPLFSS